MSATTQGKPAVSPELLKLSGMQYHGGHDAQHWIDLVGVDPRKVDGIEISKSGLCYFTKRARMLCDRYFAARRFDMDMLTGRLGV